MIWDAIVVIMTSWLWQNKSKLVQTITITYDIKPLKQHTYFDISASLRGRFHSFVNFSETVGKFSDPPNPDGTLRGTEDCDEKCIEVALRKVKAFYKAAEPCKGMLEYIITRWHGRHCISNEWQLFYISVKLANRKKKKKKRALCDWNPMVTNRVPSHD